MATIGFLQASLLGPDLPTQMEAIAPHCDRIEEAVLADSEKVRKAHLRSLFASLEPNDTLMVYSIDRICKSIRELSEIIEHLSERNIKLTFLKEGIVVDAADCFLMTTIRSVASMERSLVIEITEPGLTVINRENRRTGRRQKLSPAQKKKADQLLSQGKNKSDVASLMSVSRSCLERNIATG